MGCDGGGFTCVEVRAGVPLSWNDGNAKWFSSHDLEQRAMTFIGLILYTS